MMTSLALTAALTPATLAIEAEGGSALFGLILFVIPFLVGWFVYSSLYRRYRNQDKRYQFEQTTSAVRSELKRWDTFDRKNNRQRNSNMSGRNDNQPFERAGHSVVREAELPRQAQEERFAQQAREAQPARDAQQARAAEDARVAQQPSAPDQNPNSTPGV